MLSSSFFGVRHCSCSDSDRFLTRCRNLFLNAIYAKAAGDEVFFIWVLSFLLSDYVTLQKRFDHTISGWEYCFWGQVIGLPHFFSEANMNGSGGAMSRSLKSPSFSDLLRNARNERDLPHFFS